MYRRASATVSRFVGRATTFGTGALGAAGALGPADSVPGSDLAPALAGPPAVPAAAPVEGGAAAVEDVKPAPEHAPEHATSAASEVSEVRQANARARGRRLEYRFMGESW
jgi:hypothetical protein